MLLVVLHRLSRLGQGTLFALRLYFTDVLASIVIFLQFFICSYLILSLAIPIVTLISVPFYVRSESCFPINHMKLLPQRSIFLHFAAYEF